LHIPSPAFPLNELPRSRAARYQKELLFNPDAEHRGILLIKLSFYVSIISKLKLLFNCDILRKKSSKKIKCRL